DMRDVVEVNRAGTIVRQVTGFNIPRDARSLSYDRWLVTDGGDGRVYELDPNTGQVIWAVSGLPNASAAKRLPNGNTLIVENGVPPRVIEVTPSRTIVWSYTLGFLCVADSCSGYPTDAERLPNGNTLIAIADSTQGVMEVNPSGTIVWQYTGIIAYSATRLSNGYILMTDSRVTGGGARIASPTGELAWNYAFGDAGAPALNLPRDAQSMPDGNVLVADYGKNRVVEIDPTTNTIVWQWDSANSSPYSAVRALPLMTIRTHVPLATTRYEGAW
ncbi:MAG TPA: PQQ-binding-like beta-propeller repeat protein, partial [Dehalococcoidia bacterium]|nr:PQQ-binding-like beta-propeller repeat protein [Dehalococcoidia bacterium]